MIYRVLIKQPRMRERVVELPYIPDIGDTLYITRGCHICNGVTEPQYKKDGDLDGEVRKVHFHHNGDPDWEDSINYTIILKGQTTK